VTPAASKPRARLEIGRIGAPHGLTGEMRVALHFADSDALSRVRVVYVISESGERALDLRSVRPHGRAALLRVAGVDDRDAAAALRGARIEVDRSELEPLSPGEYYLTDLVGARVSGPEGAVGEVVGIAAHPSVTCLQLRLVDGRLAEQPLSEPWVVRVDVDALQIELSSLDGLIV
jgi:16S rRNA processing protein RimM